MTGIRMVFAPRFRRSLACLGRTLWRHPPQPRMPPYARLKNAHGSCFYFFVYSRFPEIVEVDEKLPLVSATGPASP